MIPEDEKQMINRMLADALIRIAKYALAATGIKDFTVRAEMRVEDGEPAGMEISAGRHKAGPAKRLPSAKRVADQFVKEMMTQAKKLGGAQ